MQVGESCLQHAQAQAAAFRSALCHRASGHHSGPRAARSKAGPEYLGRAQAYLETLGWEIDPDSEEHKSVRVPESLDGIIADYNELQLQQDFDLSKHLGEACEQYSYTVTNYPDPEQTVLITVYIQGKELIAGDVHSTALIGFMQGLKKP